MERRMSRGAQVIVAGAGALGLSCALALADAGCAVTVCDPGGFGRASSVAAGMLAPAFECALEPDMALHADLLFAARDQWAALEARIGLTLDRSGALALGGDVWLADIHAALVRLGVPMTEVGRGTIEALAPDVSPPDPYETAPPAISSALQRGLLVREDWRLESKPALTALRTACEASGVAFQTERVSERSAADALVLAVGYDRGLAELAPELDVLFPIKGQILRYGDVKGGGVCLRSPWGYAVPSSEGLIFGATMELGRSDLEFDAVAFADLIAGSGSLFAHQDSHAYKAERGIRAATPDGLPMVGPSRTPGVILATGARRNGWLLAPLVAQVVTAWVTGRDPGPYAARLDPARFGSGTSA
ncbi:MAG: FAD-binding oxidoreductase [Proteobacteria bacterium]|nr:FAD-binding oxidoreductase [Pseudomonadota bacterium]